MVVSLVTIVLFCFSSFVLEEWLTISIPHAIPHITIPYKTRQHVHWYATKSDATFEGNIIVYKITTGEAAVSLPLLPWKSF